MLISCSALSCSVSLHHAYLAIEKEKKATLCDGKVMNETVRTFYSMIALSCKVFYYIMTVLLEGIFNKLIMCAMNFEL